ncbi:MAG: hypothetical protein NTV14_09680 [Coprothermobacterota bacterium]|nr:hypothetical protein [Coprothermobacterota bacterium]
MRARAIKPGFFKNEGLAACSQAARLLFVGLWLLADREGRLEDRPKRIEAEIFPYEEVNVEELLNELAVNRDGNGAFIRRYIVEGHRYIAIVNFIRHQYPHKNEQKSIIPAPPKVAPEEDQQDSPEIPGVDPVIFGACPAVLLTPDSLTPDSLTAVNLTPYSLGEEKARTAQKAATVRPFTPPSPQSVVSSQKQKDSILPAVEAYREITRLYPPKVVWSTVGEGVGSSPPELARWRETIIAWVGHGFKKTNVLGMLECFRRGELPGRDHHPPGNGSYGVARGASPPFLNKKAQAWSDLQLDEEGNPIGDVLLLNQKAQAWADLKIEEEKKEENQK